MAEPILSVKNLTVKFGKRKRPFTAVDDVSFDIFKGETFGLVGESGSGKTTIGRAIIRVVPTAGGEILFNGEKINGKIPKALDKQIPGKIQMIFQDPMASLNERAKVDYIVSEGIYRNTPKRERDERVVEALKSVGLLPEFAGRFPHEFSGGQRQRIGVARALVMEPEFIIADEPISALDVSIRAQVLNLLSDLQKERGLTYLFISHDLSVMRFICDRIAVIHKGKIVELANTERLFENPLHPYTKALLSAVPMPDPDSEKKKKLIVYDPNMHDYSKDAPGWMEIEPGHFVYANSKEYMAYERIVRKLNGNFDVSASDAFSRCWAEVDLSAVASNYKTAKAMLADGAKLMPVVKANAYGLGAKYMAGELFLAGADTFCAASIAEAEEVRDVAPLADVLVMGAVGESEAARAAVGGIMLTAYSRESAERILSAAKSVSRAARVHIKIETGLHRLGFDIDDFEYIAQFAKNPLIKIEGIFSHLALRDPESDRRQFQSFDTIISRLRDMGIDTGVSHICDSIGMVRYPERHMGSVRVGAFLWGVCPYRWEHPEKCLPVLALKARVAQIRNLKKGECVGYDDEHPLERDSRVATITAGYVDGYPRFNNEGFVEIRSKRAKVLGLVCMDQMMVDVTDIPDVACGDTATLLGGGITVDEYAKIAHMNRNEALSRVGRRVPRVYMRNGEIEFIASEMKRRADLT